MGELEAIREMQDYWILEQQDMEKEFQKQLQIIRDSAQMTTSVAASVYTGDMTISATGTSEIQLDANFVEKMLKQADNNLLTIVDRVNDEAVALVGEDDFKKRAKEVLGTAIGQEAAKKAKFTMLRDPRGQQTITKARVYAFSEEELKTFIKNIAKQVK